MEVRNHHTRLPQHLVGQSSSLLATTVWNSYSSLMETKMSSHSSKKLFRKVIWRFFKKQPEEKKVEKKPTEMSYEEFLKRGNQIGIEGGDDDDDD